MQVITHRLAALSTPVHNQTKWIWVQKYTDFHPHTILHGPNLPPIYFVE